MTSLAPKPPVFLSRDDCDLREFAALLESGTDLADYPYADAVSGGVLIYSDRLLDHLDTASGRRDVQAEIARALSDGPGIVVFRNAFDPDLIDRATAAFFDLLAQEKAAGMVGGDHFAKPGANDRVWNALEKLAVADPALFAEYFSNDYVALAAGAWLGANYQMNAALNIVNPGGRAQVAHRDYHLGFMPLETALTYPAHVHRLSPALTLQGAVAHCDMPIETGPTLYLPHSHKYLPGYVAFSLPEFQEYFAEHHVQQALGKGDAVFFNPALMHGAGTNTTPDVRRMANLLQISSAFGRCLEAVDTTRMSIAVYPTLQELSAAGTPARLVDNVVTAVSEGYPYPTNLDRDQPLGSINPQSQSDLLRQALAEGWTPARTTEALLAQAARHLTH
ncbi:phytanoyl-CoA dioxygenase family protein [Nakamurella flavida]|uniref:Phytanoyl-CoA dioxygenase family protein n=1 Tax=Nakamurella flavida TaxID=363630 RepID=A0A938YP51_9ACTN|nr:phytanoyl-CoA dioxygenase family protein [Nakamurella flavida]MBM9476937.1 phytanoyl-CoA dioxygenase family protein [Nakamurella flavida]MDP9779882.1 ectoine hydroxylase-related dioxygenase (phytanoyl-CoA dioxygenase family) [Nakamurella flavida]